MRKHLERSADGTQNRANASSRKRTSNADAHMRICTHAYAHTNALTYARIRTHAYSQTHIRMRIRVRMRIRARKRLRIRVRKRLRIRVRKRLRICVRKRLRIRVRMRIHIAYECEYATHAHLRMYAYAHAKRICMRKLGGLRDPGSGEKRKYG